MDHVEPSSVWKKGRVTEKKEKEFRESLSVDVKGVGTVNGAAETLSENLAQQ